jgi:methylphosphotriester-DNA--protein-cysteine methyltransferase
VIVPAEARYHRSGCTLIRLFDVEDLDVLTRQEAEAKGYVPCRACKPDNPL